MSPTLRILAGLALLSVPSAADVRLQTPNGGEILRPGSTVTIEWMIETQGELDPLGGFAGPSNPNRRVRTNATNWDLFYSTEGPAGPWIVMAKDLAINDMNAGSTHAFDWTVPNTPSMDVWIRVRMDTPGIDYSDSSDDSQYVRAGAEFDAFGWLQLRVGAQFDFEDTTEDLLTAGLGFSPFDVFHFAIAGMLGEDDTYGAVLQTSVTF